MEARKRRNQGAVGLNTYYFTSDGTRYDYEVDNYVKSSWSLIANEPIQSIFYINDTDIKSDIPYVTGVPAWKTFDLGPFDPSNKSDGWYKHNGKQYYVENHACATGWKKVDNCWYFFNPASGNNHKNDYETGEMLTGWVWLDDHWYFFNPENGMMQTGWVWSKAYQAWYYFYTSGSEAGQMAKSAWIENIYYVLSNGMMAKNCQILYNGKYYAFNNSGECLNTSGQTSPYNTTTYPIKS